MFLALVVLTPIAAQAQSTRSYPVPKRIEPGAAEETTLTFILGKIYPIGFSDDGKFAFVTEFEGPSMAPELSEFVVIIQDLVTDEIVWRWSSMSGETFDEETLRRVWRENQETISTEMARYKINGDRPVTFVQGNHAKLAGREYTFELIPQINGKEFSRPDGSGSFTENIIFYTEVSVISPQLGWKTIYSGTPSQDTISVEVVGSILSPFESRAAVVLASAYYGYQLEIRYDYVIIGAHLTVNFR